MPYPVIDGDGLIYRCGFAAQHRVYEFDDKEFKSKKELNAYLDSFSGGMDISMPYTFRIEAEPMENALANIKGAMSSILNFLEADKYKLFISSNTPTFRDKLAKIKPYKGNRADVDKPIHYDACRKYLKEAWLAKECFGIEADDACGIHQFKYEDSVIVSNDKDMRQIPGFHYDWTKEGAKVVYVDEDEALYQKYVQVLSGDPTDNIEGIPGLGDKGAAKLLQGMFGSAEYEYDDVCRSIYDEYFNSDDIIKHLKMSYVDYVSNILHMTPNDVYEETKALITILTKEPELDKGEIG